MCSRVFGLKVVLIALMWLWVASACISERSFGPQITEKRNVGQFDGVKVQHGIDVFIVSGESGQVEVKTAKRLVDDLRTEVENGILHIHFSGAWSMGRFGEVYIQGEHISTIEASSGSDISSAVVLSAPSILVRCSSGSDIDTDVETDHLDIQCSSGSDAVIGGTADRMQAAASSGSDLKAMNLVVREARLKASGGSDIHVHVLEALYGEASGGSDIVYRGSPAEIDVGTSSGSEVTKAGS